MRVQSLEIFHQVLSSLPTSVSEIIERKFDIAKPKIVVVSNSDFGTLITRSEEVGRSLQDRSRHSAPPTGSVPEIPPPS